MFYSAINDFPILALASLGFYISLRFLKFPDLSVDASIMFGGSALVWTLQHHIVSEFVALFIAIGFGFAVGCLTGILHTANSVKMNKFLAGMLVAFGAYSVCFRIAGKSANISLFEYKDSMLFSRALQGSHQLIEPFVLTILVLLTWYIVQRGLNSSFGYSLRTAGHRPEILSVCGINPNVVTILGLGLANSLVACSGWLDSVVNLNVSLVPFGSIINILAACLIGDFIRYSASNLLSKKNAYLRRHVAVLIISPIVGALAFSFIKAFVLKFLSGELEIALTTDLYLIVSMSILFVSWLGRKFNNFGETEDDMEL